MKWKLADISSTIYTHFTFVFIVFLQEFIILCRKLEGSDPVVGSEPAPEVTKERFFEVGIDFKNSKATNEDKKGMTFDFLADDNVDYDEGTKPISTSSGMTFNFLGNKSESEADSDEDELEAPAKTGWWSF